MPMESKSPDPRKAPQINHLPIVGVDSVMAIASGKGGVGKSTATVMLAYALQQIGQRVSILDADIYGPSIPRMLGLQDDEQPDLTDNGLMIPRIGQGIACNSMGFLVPQNVATVWRGPMITKALAKLARGTKWGSSPPVHTPHLTPHTSMHTLLTDFPPGTGDIQLSMAQQVPLSGAIVVTTPQEVALADARKCCDMFGKLQVPVLGIIENMSWFETPDGQRHYLFGEGGGQRLADEYGVPLLGQIPQLPTLTMAMDEGERPSDAAIRLFHPIAEKING